MKMLKVIFKFYNFLILLLLLASFEIIYLVKQNQQLKKKLISYNKNQKILSKGDILKIFPLNNINGNPKQLHDYFIDNNHVFLLFLSTNCPACEKDIPFWREIHRRCQSSKLAIIGVSLDNEIETKRFKYFNKLDFDIFIDDKKNNFFRANNIRSVPTLALVSKDGLVENLWIGSIGDKEKDIIINKLPKIK